MDKHTDRKSAPRYHLTVTLRVHKFLICISGALGSGGADCLQQTNGRGRKRLPLKG